MESAWNAKSWMVGAAAAAPADAHTDTAMAATRRRDLASNMSPSQDIQTTARLLLESGAIVASHDHPYKMADVNLICCQRCERLFDIGHQVAHIFETNGQPHGSRADARLAGLLGGEIARPDELRGHDQRFGAAEARRERK